MSSTPQHVMVSAFEGLRDYDPTEATGCLAVPAVYIAADELKPRSDMTRFHELAPEILYGKTVGSGHFCQLEVPEQVNAMIERFLSVSLVDQRPEHSGIFIGSTLERLVGWRRYRDLDGGGAQQQDMPKRITDCAEGEEAKVREELMEEVSQAMKAHGHDSTQVREVC